MSEDIETFCVGHPLDYAIQGVSQLPSRRKRKPIAESIAEEYGTEIDGDTASVIDRLQKASNSTALVTSVKEAGLDTVDDYTTVLTDTLLDEDEEADLGRVMDVLDTNISYSLAPREKDASKVSSKRQRDTTYIPEVINAVGDSGDVFMAKTLSTTAKVRMAWDLHDDNQVIVVDSYEKWEKLLGWRKLKELPHGKNKIREELGDQLSDDVLDIVAADDAGGDTDTKDESDTDSKGRRTRTQPSDEVLNVATSSRHRDRRKIQSQDILEALQDDGEFGKAYSPIDMLVLFPSTTDLNMSDHWWVAGSRWHDVGQVAIANCNKGTFEYLNQHDSVWHIEDYRNQADDYEFETNHGPVTLGTVDRANLVLHVVDNDMHPRLMQGTAIENMPNALPDYCDNAMYNSPSFPHADDMLYAPLTLEDVFWMRPELRKMQSPEDGDGILLYASEKPRNVGTKWNMSSDYELYARARLPDWDFDSVEMSVLDNASYKIELDDGGYELVETLAKLHDNGMQPYSETPQSRWTQ